MDYNREVELRLECLKQAMQSSAPEMEVTEMADYFYRYVMDGRSQPPTPIAEETKDRMN